MRSRKIFATLMIWLLAFSATSILTFSTPVTLSTDKETYYRGDEVKISGASDANESVTIIITHNGETLYNETSEADGDGNFSTSFNIPTDSEHGEYMVQAASGNETITTVFAVEESPCELAWSLISLINGSKANAESAFEELYEKEVEIPQEAEEAYELAGEVTEEALELYYSGNCTDAAEKANEALNLYGEAAELAYEALPEPEVEELATAEEENGDGNDVAGLLVAIDRAERFRDRILYLAGNLEETLDVSPIEELGELLDNATKRLEKAKLLLGQAESGSDDAKVSEAAKLKAEARGLLGRAMGLLNSGYKEKKLEKAAKFLEKAEERLMRMEERVNRILEGLPVSARDRVGIMNSFRNTERKIEELRALLESGELEGAVEGLEDLDEDEDEILEAVEVHEEGRMGELKQIERLEAKIESLEERIEKFSGVGKDVSDLEQQLQDAKDLLAEVLARLEAGESIQGLLDDTEDEIEDLDDAFDELDEDEETEEEDDED